MRVLSMDPGFTPLYAAMMTNPQAGPALPSMRKRMLRRKELLSKFTSRNPAAAVDGGELPPSPSYSQPAESKDPVFMAADPQARRHSADTISSVVTSICSAPSLMTNYGLRRALTSVVVPNESNPIATVKDRKNANYLESVNDTKDSLRGEVDKAIAEFNRITDLRDKNRNQNIQDLLNRSNLDANNKLSKCICEYAAFCDSLNELRALPKMSRDELERRFTIHKVKAKLDRNDEGAAMKKHVRDIETKIVDLELEREDLIRQTGAVSEQVIYVEHVNRSLGNRHDHIRRELEQFRREIKRLMKKDDQNSDALDHLTEDCAYLSHLNTHLTRELDTTKSLLSEKDIEAQALRAQLVQAQSNEKHGHAQFAEAHTDIRNLHSQLSFATATAGFVKNENKDLRRQIEDLNYALKGSQDQLQNMHELNTRLQESGAILRSSVTHLRDEFNEVEAQAEDYRQKYRDSTADADEYRRMYQDSTAEAIKSRKQADELRLKCSQLKAENAELRRKTLEQIAANEQEVAATRKLIAAKRSASA